MTDLRAELLVFEGCPHADEARRDLESVLREGIVETPIQVVLVTSMDDAEFLGFQGSPTIRINGQDVVPMPELAVALGCRVYRADDGRVVGSPPIERIREVVDGHRRGRLQAFQRDEAGRVASFARDAAESEDQARLDPETKGDSTSDTSTKEPAE